MTGEQIDEVKRRIETLEAGRFRPEGAWTRPSDAADSVPWGSLTDEQKYDVLSASVDWRGFDAGQIVDVSRRVVEGESSEFWMDGLGGEGAPPDPAMERVVTEIEGALVAREALLSETYRLTREIGFVGFRREFINDPAAITEWHDRADREKGLREAWDEIGDFGAYLRSHADVGIDVLTQHRELLLAIQSGPEDAQVEFYRSAGEFGRDQRLAANDNAPAWRSEFNDMMRDIPNPPRFESDYEKAIQRVADSAVNRQPDKDRGPER